MTSRPNSLSPVSHKSTVAVVTTVLIGLALSPWAPSPEAWAGDSLEPEAVEQVDSSETKVATDTTEPPKASPYVDAASLQNAMAKGAFAELTEDELKIHLEHIDPIVLIDAALTTLSKRPEYSTVLEKQERVRGELQEQPDVIAVKYRREPLAMFLNYPGGVSIERQVLYDDVIRPGEITVAESGLLGFMSLNIDVDSPLTKRSTNHTVMELGLEFPLVIMRAEVVALAKAGRAVNLADGRLVVENGRRFWEIEVETPGPPNYYAAHSRLRFEVDTALVAMMEIRDKKGLMVERFEYKDTVWGKHPEGTFDVDNPAYRF